jgi:hypothetical protein
MIDPPTRRPGPVGVHLICEACAAEAIVALPASRDPFGVVACPSCRATYLVSLGAPEHEVAPPALAG